MFGETPMGGTELMVNKLYQLLPNKLLEEYDITHIPREIAKGKKGIMWWHLSYDQELVQVLKDRNNYLLLPRLLTQQHLPILRG